jgi:perosamine synthetase
LMNSGNFSMPAIRNSPDSLAIDGGRPVRASLLPYGRQQICEADIQAVVDVLRSDWLTTGPKVEAFEEAFADAVGARHAVAVSSGTAALHAAVAAAGVASGDEVITSPLTFCASANCAVYQGARPVFGDVKPDTLNLDPEHFGRRISSRTRVVIPVDYAGHPADIDDFMTLADRHGLVIVEDACHALGATIAGRSIGSRSHMTVFSFHPVKHITTGEGGMVTTDDATLAQKLRVIRNHGIDTDARSRQAQGAWTYDMSVLGYNYRLSDIGCALGLSQLSSLPSNLARRRQIADRYSAVFRSLPGLTLPVVSAGVDHAWHLYPVRVDPERVRGGRERVFHALRAEGIGVTVHYPAVHLHTYYRERFGHRPGDYPIAEAAADTLLSLPLFPAMTDQDASDVIEAVHKVLTHDAV